MKRGLLLVVSVAVAALCMALSVTTFAAFALQPSSNPADEGAFTIGSAAEFLEFSEHIADSPARGKGESFVLTADLDLTSYSGFSPIGGLNTAFAGSFDGRYHKIKIALSGTDYTGLFGSVASGGKVKNLTVCGSVTGDGHVGGIAGINLGEISNCINEATVEGSADYVGGIAGATTSKIVDCINTGTVKGRESYVGGITGESYGGEIVGCFNAGKVSLGKNNCGGIVGRSFNSAKISACVNFGEINSIDGNAVSYIGGIVGETAGTVADCYNYAPLPLSSTTVGSAIGRIVTLTAECGRVYNVGNKSVKSPVGTSTPAIPSDYKQISVFDVLSGKDLFSADTLVLPKFDTGYGYLSCPKVISTDERSSYLQLFKEKLFPEGDGTEEHPFIIKNIEDWTLFAQNTRVKNYEGMFVKAALAKDDEEFGSLNLGECLPLGVPTDGEAVPFAGQFDGGGNKLVYSVNSKNAGLFGIIAPSGVVKNLNVDAEIFSDEETSTGGSIAYECYGEINNVTASGSVYVRLTAGGITAKLLGSSAKLIDCDNKATVRGKDYVGGILGYGLNVSKLSRLTNSGTVNTVAAYTHSYFGGIGGYIKNETPVSADYLVNKANVTATDGFCVGGIFGYCEKAVLKGAFNVGDIDGKENVGGLFGSSSGNTVSNAGAIAKIKAAKNVGGLVGEGSCNLVGSYFSGSLERASGAKPETFRALAPQGSSLKYTYYNSDIINAEFEGEEGKSYVEMTNGLFTGFDYFSDPDGLFAAEEKWDYMWECPWRETAYGTLPLLYFDKVMEDTALIDNKAKYKYFSSGDGSSPANPFTVFGEQQFRNLAELLEKYDEYMYYCYKLVSSIDFVRNAPYTPSLGYGAEKEFLGWFDGGGYELKSVNLSGPLFGILHSGASVSNLGLKGGASVGASIAAEAKVDSVINNCFSTLNVGGTNCGGLVLKNAGEISGCVFAGRIKATEDAGGISRENLGNIFDCAVNCYIEGKLVGGVCAKNSGSVRGVVVNGTVNGLDDVKTVGGFFGSFASENDLVVKDNLFLGARLYNGKLNDNVAIVAGNITGNLPQEGNLRVIYNADVYGYTALVYRRNNALIINSDSLGFGKSQANEILVGDMGFSADTEIAITGQRGKDSDFAPVNKVFSPEENSFAAIIELAKEASGIGIFGRDFCSDKAWGSKENPYLISTAEQFSDLAGLVSKDNDYDGDYFALTADLDFGVTPLNPIGRYYGAAANNNAYFNGNLSGGYHKISGLNMNFDYDYVGIFGYTGEHFSVENLYIDNTCKISTSSNYAGSVVGYNKGRLTNVISKAEVSGNAFVGGLVGYSENGTTIRSSVFAGQIAATDENSAFGITGQNKSGVLNIDTTDTKYLHSRRNTYIEIGQEGYGHNGYGDVVFVDRGGNVDVNFDETSKEITFVATCDEGVYVKVMTKGNNVVYDEGKKVPVFAFGAISTSDFYYFRFTYETKLVPDTAQGVDLSKVLAQESYGSGRYYQGQTVGFVLEMNHGYFVYSCDEGVTMTNGGERIMLSFEVAVVNKKCDINIVFKKFDDFYKISLNESDKIYDGQSKELEAELKAGGEDIFQPFNYVFYDKETGAVQSEFKDAGIYTVKISLIKKDTDILLGTTSFDVQIGRKELSVDTDNAYWSDTYAVKDYDGESVTSGRPIKQELITGIYENDKTGVVLSATVDWGNADKGDYTQVEISDFVLSGNRASNYSVNAESMNKAGKINVRTITASIPDSALKSVYNGDAPLITSVSYSFSIGSATVKWSFAKLKDGVVDSTWKETDNIWDVGEYKIIPSINDENFVFADSQLIYEITQREITEIVYDGIKNLEYTGQALNSRIKGTYLRGNGGQEPVSFNFYDEHENAIQSIIDAGTYYAEPKIQNTNYILSESIGKLQFIVDRATIGDIKFDLLLDESGEVTVGDRIKIVLHGEVYDHQYSAEGYGDIRGKAIVEEGEKEDGKRTFYLVPTAYPASGTYSFLLKASGSKNYKDASSRDLKTVKVNAGIIYVGISEATSVISYGDVPAYELVYSKDSAQNEIVDISTIENVDALPKIPVVENREVGEYYISIHGGSSDGYKFVTSDKNKLVVKQKKILIAIPSTAQLSSEYGENDIDIEYIVYEYYTEVQNGEEQEQVRKITELPNGKPLGLQGALSRNAGRDVGLYPINKGTLVYDEEKGTNTNYDIHYDIGAKSYEVKGRQIALIVEECEKAYGESDPEITVALQENYSFAYNDKINVLDVKITREAGENVGEYGFIRENADGGKNYIILRVDTDTNKFKINKATPGITCYEDRLGTLRYGDRVDTLTIVGKAMVGIMDIEGIFGFSNGEDIATALGPKILEYTFTPTDSDNYEEVEANITVEVLPRIAEIQFVGSAYYIYNGLAQGGQEITAKVINAVSEEDEFDLTYVYDNKRSINIGKYAVYVTAVGNSKYVLNERLATEKGLAFEYEIQRATITVSTNGGKIKEGEKFTPTIQYKGFVAGESEQVLKSRASVSVPTAVGIHTIVPSGASADNYRFVYLGAELIIEREVMSSGNVTVRGELGTNFMFTADGVTSEIGLDNSAKAVDDAMKYNVVKPNPMKIKEYYKLENNISVEGDLDYEIRLNYSVGDKIYLKLQSGKIVELADFEAEEDGDVYLISFTSEQISGIAVYEKKEMKEMLIGYIPLIAIIGGVALFGIIVAVVLIVRHKKDDKKREYLSRFD